MKQQYRIFLVFLVLTATSVSQQSHTIDTQTKVELGLAFGAIAADGYTTVWNGGKYSYEYNALIGKRKGNAGFDAAYFGGSAATLVGGDYILRHHPRLKHALNWAVIGTESYWTGYNISHHRR